MATNELKRCTNAKEPPLIVIAPKLSDGVRSFYNTLVFRVSGPYIIYTLYSKTMNILELGEEGYQYGSRESVTRP